MITTLFDTLGRWCVTWPRCVLACFGLLTLGAIPFVSYLALEADVRNMLPGHMAKTLERHQTLFGTSDLALLLVQTTQERPDDLIAFGTALQQQLSPSPLIRQVDFGYARPVLSVMEKVALDYAPFLVHPDQLDALDR